MHWQWSFFLLWCSTGNFISGKQLATVEDKRFFLPLAELSGQPIPVNRILIACHSKGNMLPSWDRYAQLMGKFGRRLFQINHLAFPAGQFQCIYWKTYHFPPTVKWPHRILYMHWTSVYIFRGLYQNSSNKSPITNPHGPTSPACGLCVIAVCRLIWLNRGVGNPIP